MQGPTGASFAHPPAADAPSHAATAAAGVMGLQSITGMGEETAAATGEGIGVAMGNGWAAAAAATPLPAAADAGTVAAPPAAAAAAADAAPPPAAASADTAPIAAEGREGRRRETEDSSFGTKRHKKGGTTHSTLPTLHHPLTPPPLHHPLYTTHFTPLYTTLFTPPPLHHPLYTTTIHHIPHTIYHTPYATHHTPCTIHHTPHTIHHTPTSTLVTKSCVSIKLHTPGQLLSLTKPRAHKPQVMPTTLLILLRMSTRPYGTWTLLNPTSAWVLQIVHSQELLMQHKKRHTHQQHQQLVLMATGALLAGDCPLIGRCCEVRKFWMW